MKSLIDRKAALREDGGSKTWNTGDPIIATNSQTISLIAVTTGANLFTVSLIAINKKLNPMNSAFSVKLRKFILTFYLPIYIIYIQRIHTYMHWDRCKRDPAGRSTLARSTAGGRLLE